MWMIGNGMLKGGIGSSYLFKIFLGLAVGDHVIALFNDDILVWKA
jgi:hypothetical protein